MVVNDKIAAFFQQVYLPSIISDVTNNKVKNKKKLLGQKVFKNPQFQSVFIFFKCVHLCLLSLYYQYLLWMFWSIIFMFDSIWVAVPSVRILIKYVLRVPTWTFKRKSNRPRSSCKQNTCPLEKISFPACYNSTWWRRHEDNILEHWGMNTFISPLSFGALRNHNHVENLSP